MIASQSKVVAADHEGHLSSSQKPILFRGFLLLETDFLIELEIRNDLVQSKQKQSSRPASQSLENYFPEADREDLNSSKESILSTSLIHNIASDG